MKIANYSLSNERGDCLFLNNGYLGKYSDWLSESESLNAKSIGDSDTLKIRNYLFDGWIVFQ